MPSTERLIIEAFRLSDEQSPIPVISEVAYDLLWLTASWGAEARRTEFEAAFGIIIFQIEGIGFVAISLIGWWLGYLASIAEGETDVTAGCPCNAF